MDHPSLPPAAVSRSPARVILRWLGRAIAAAGVVFVAVQLHGQAAEIDLSSISASIWALLTGLALAYGASGCLLGLAWGELLGHLGVKVKPGWAMRAYGIAQLAKYVPGNVFHLAGRQALAAAAGLPHGPVARSALWELVVIAGAGALFVLLAFPPALGLPPLLGVALFAAALPAALWAAGRVIGPAVRRAIALQTIFLALSGLGFVGVLAVGPGALPEAPVLIAVAGAYVVAWLGGMLTPGSPAGIGVRELILFFALDAVVARPDLVAALVLGRLVTVAGDAAFYAGAALFPVKGR